ncbi:putative P-loop ATPase [Novosphingobium hassiacum]|uniref:Putative P-loop ATPase n=1 Tax=Novosphingobium hassiacum TaxID=173676 RepID=A0A7W6EUR7_9SPHN|nr:putative P-loop ATPase [Novosphingobium hassiacum]
MTDTTAPTSIGTEPSTSKSRKLKPFPARLNPEEFPNPPSQGGHKLPLTMDNVEHLLAGNSINVSYDVISKRLSILHNARQLEECDLISLANLNGVPSGQVLDFIGTLGRRNGSNPVADWIKSRPWDGSDRLQQLYHTVHVEESYPTEMRDALIYRWCLSAVAAALSLGNFHSRGVLTLQGPQGSGKTSWIARLVPEDLRRAWFKRDHHLDPCSKDSVLVAVAHGIVELGELDSSFRRDVARLKGFITNDCDRVRPPYAARAVDMGRRTVCSLRQR